MDAQLSHKAVVGNRLTPAKQKGGRMILPPFAISAPCLLFGRGGFFFYRQGHEARIARTAHQQKQGFAPGILGLGQAGLKIL